MYGTLSSLTYLHDEWWDEANAFSIQSKRWLYENEFEFLQRSIVSTLFLSCSVLMSHRRSIAAPSVTVSPDFFPPKSCVGSI